MPFESERQRRFMHANHPEIAERWEHEMSAQGRDPYGNNARNFDSDTYDNDILQPSATPFVSATPTGLPQGFSGPTEDVMLSTQGTAVHVMPGGDVKTRFKYGPADQGGDMGVSGGTP